MQTGILLLKQSLLGLVLLAILPGVSWAASSFKADTSGLCCVNSILKESTEKQCQKARGKFYSIKEKTKAQKECRSAKPATPPKIRISPKTPPKTEVPGFCCVNGIVKKATKGQCSKMKGSYSQSSVQAKQNCKPKKIFCCVEGKVTSVSSSDCKKRRGTIYTSVAEAKKKCKPATVYCCSDGKITKVSPQRCTQHKGTAYKSATEAKQKCKAPDIYCYVNDTVRKMSSKQCRSKKGKEFKTKAEAEKMSRQQKNRRKALLLQRTSAANKARPEQNKPTGLHSKIGKVTNNGKTTTATIDGYCCADGKVSPQNNKGCEKKKGLFFKSRISAEKACRAQRTDRVATKQNSKPTANLLLGATGVTMAQSAQGKVTGMDSKVGNIEGLEEEPVAGVANIATMERCTVRGTILVDGFAPVEQLRIAVTPVSEGQERRYESNGSFFFTVPEGNHLIEPFFPAGSVYGQSIQAQEIICQLDFVKDISIEFIHTSPSICILTGRVNGNGNTVNSLILHSLAPGGETLPVAVNGGNYSVEIPWGTSYTLTPEISAGAATPETKEFTIYPGQRSHVVDFELASSLFQFASFKVLGFERNRQIEGLPTQVRFEIRTISSGSEGRYNRSVRITSPENPQVNLAQNCVFKAEGKCEFTLSIDGINTQTDSICAEIIGHDDEPNVTRTWTAPFQLTRGDLRSSKYYIVKTNENTASNLYVRNISTTADSLPCSMDVKINGGNSRTFQIPALAAGAEHHINYQRSNWAPRIGDLLSFQIDDSCDSYSRNNQVSHRVTDEYYFDASREDAGGIVGVLDAIGDFLF